MSMENVPNVPTVDSLSAPDPSLSFASMVKIVVLLVCVVVTVAMCLKASDLNTASEPGVELALPDRIGDFVGVSEEMSVKEREILPPDTGFIRKTYTNGAGEKISASIVLAGGEKRSIHRPQICLTAQGWTIGASNTEKISLASGNHLDVMRLDLRRQVEIRPGVFRPLQSEFLYWFVGKETATPYNMVRIFKTSWDRVFHRTNHRWAYVIVTALVPEGAPGDSGGAAQTDEMLKKFVAQVVPYFQKSEMNVASVASATTKNP